MIIKTNKAWVLDLLKDSNHTKDIEKIEGDTLEILIDTPEKIRSEAQRRTYYKLLTMFDKSGFASYPINILKNKHKETAGMLHYTKLDMTSDMEKVQRTIYSNLPNSKLKEELGNLINNGRGDYESISDATIEQMTAMIKAILVDIRQSGFTSKELDRIMERIYGMYIWYVIQK